MIVKAAIGFLTTDSDAQLIVDTQSAISGLTGNPDFPTPSPSVTTVTTALSAFTVALADAANGGMEYTAIKNAKRAELCSLMRQLAAYVTITAGGDMAKLLSSGFQFQKPVRQTIGQLPAPYAPVLTLGEKSGQLNALVPPIYGAMVYTWRLALASAPTTYLRTVQTTGGRILFDALTAGQTYNVDVNATGTAGESDWSDVGGLMVV